MLSRHALRFAGPEGSPARLAALAGRATAHDGRGRGRSLKRLALGALTSEVSIQSRTAYGSELVQRRLAAAGIPHRALGSLGLYERSEGGDVLAYLALLANPRDARAFARAIAAPRGGVGDQAQARWWPSHASGLTAIAEDFIYPTFT